jgi:hypothetical protein
LKREEGNNGESKRGEASLKNYPPPLQDWRGGLRE